ncbi:beta-glucoside-specific PTS transporter subunit IIABC [Bifidobacterium callitrichos]|uniref:beta-glucoside-specific PTS transporter subunit IIABC n=2 Tax=Bifidobacterium callitrichos TaxID=762209 RepID=UPI0005B9A2D1|nr:beta-glucoside-specific PTS transporter subunit IIABC [Bifidobacterium callitrichos]
MDYRKTASAVVELVGGTGNVQQLEHCSTRLRFTLKDQSKADPEALKQVPGVLGVAMGGQFQVIIGNDVVEVYDEIMKMPGIGSDSPSNAAAAPADAKPGRFNMKRAGRAALDFFIAVFQPLVPAIAGGGVLKALLSLFSMLGWMDSKSSVYTIFLAIGDAPLYFLPLLVAATAAKRLKINQLVAISAVSALMIPNITAALSAEGGTKLFGFTLQNITYAYQVFPALLSVLFLYFVERLFNKYTPKAIRIFFVPMMCFVIVVPVTLLLLGPLGYNAGTLLTAFILAVYSKLGFIAVALLAMVLPFCIAIGMHKAFIPYALAALAQAGSELLYMPASLAHNISESGACFAVFLRTKDQNLKATALSAAISALFGITEPALYGVTLQHKRAMTGVVAGSGIAGLTIGLLGVQAFTAVGPGLASMPMFIDPNGKLTNNLTYAFIGFAVAILASFLITLILFKDPAKTSVAATVSAGAPSAASTPAPTATVMPASDVVDVQLASPMDGTVIPLDKVADDVFAGKVLGDGLAVTPITGELRAPAAGTVCMVPDSRHAIGLALDNGAEILMHVGLDTVKLQGAHFTTNVKVGDRVNAGDLLLTFDRDAITKAGYDLTTPIVVANGGRYAVTGTHEGPVKTGDALYTVITK